MKRYWRLITIAAVVVLSIGTFYIQSALSADSYPEITIEKVSGNEDVLEPVVIDGRYTTDYGMGESVEITSDGSTYRSEQSFLERIQGMDGSDISYLKDNYRGFMRGKSAAVNSFYNTDDTLAYADVINQSHYASPQDSASEAEFNIDVLNKESNNKTSFTVPVPNRAMYTNVIVADVQMSKEDLNVFTRNYTRSEEGTRQLNKELHVYSFDIAKQEINGEEKISVFDGQGDDTRISINSLRNSDQTAAHNIIIFERTRDVIGQRNENSQGNVAAEGPVTQSETDYVVYNLETGEKTTLEPPEALSNHRVISRDNNTLYFRGENEIAAYNMKADEIEMRLDMPTYQGSEEDPGASGSIIKIADQKIYLLTTNTQKQNAQQLSVFDISTGDELYQGVIKPESSVRADASWQFYEMNLQ